MRYVLGAALVGAAVGAFWLYRKGRSAGQASILNSPKTATRGAVYTGGPKAN